MSSVKGRIAFLHDKIIGSMEKATFHLSLPQSIPTTLTI